MLEELKNSAAGNVMSGVRNVNETELREIKFVTWLCKIDK